MKLELYYVVMKYFDDGTEMSKAHYESGPFKTWEEAETNKLCHWLHNNRYVVVKQTIDVEEM